MSPDPGGRLELDFTLNGSPVRVGIDPGERLLDTLRYGLGLTGTKEGCGEGECGSCTVHLDGLPVMSCLVPAWQAGGRSVRTVESVPAEQIRPLLATGATQCGACTPGVVMTAVWVAAQPDLLESHTMRELMAGNLCRCTGYDGIAEGVEAMIRSPDPGPGS